MNKKINLFNQRIYLERETISTFLNFNPLTLNNFDHPVILMI